MFATTIILCVLALAYGGFASVNTRNNGHIAITVFAVIASVYSFVLIPVVTHHPEWFIPR